MVFKINGQDLPVKPKSLEVGVIDLDDEETTKRTVNGTLVRNRITQKRQIDIEFAVLTWSQLSRIFNLIKNTFFTVTYPDPLSGTYETRTFYCSERKAKAIMEKNGILLWNDVKLTFTEK